ncbi:MAG: PEP-CTERM sorting domain-containing protein [Aquabacterium sp.]|nr:PEP-CTERM sorting domain-containing protein [Aquabacterium sp.]
MTFKFASAALAGLLASSAALAANPDSITKSLTLVPDDTDPSFSFATVDVRQLSPKQVFNDYYTFHLDGLSDVSFSAISDPLLNAKGNVVLKAAVFDSIKLSGPNDFMGGGTISANGLYTKLSFEKLIAGDYTVTLTGHAVGKSGGNYYGNLAVTAAVPEPEVLAMGLAGLGVVGLLARRRKAN